MSKKRATLPLQKMVSLTLALGISAFVALSFIILNLVITPAFDELELSAARTDLVRAEQAVLTDIESLAAASADWALWDDIYEYINDRHPGFNNSNLQRSTLNHLGLDMMAIYSSDQALNWSMLLVDNEQRDLSELGILNEQDLHARQLIHHENLDSKLAGLVATDLGPMLLSTRPILRTDESGPIAGTLIMAQFLNSARLERLRERTEVRMQLLGFDELMASPNAAASRSILHDEVGFSTSKRTISSFTLLPDLFNERPLVLRTETARDISLLGSKTIRAALLLLGLAGCLLAVAVWYLLRGKILRPIERLAKHIRKVRRSGDLTKNLDMNRNDEIGALAAQFDNLTSAVHDARQALLDQSFKAGKADTAAEVLHNIRNAMTPMINGIERLSKAYAVTDSLRIAEVTAQLADSECSPERADKLLQYIDASFKRIEEVGAEAADDLKIVTSQARQVEAILSDQEKFTNVAPVTENITVDDVLGEAAHVIPKNSVPSIRLELAEGLSAFSVRAHRIGLLQVMGNLILNAYESIQRSNKADGEIRLFASGDTIDDKAMVRLTIYDNGTGFSADIRTRIFERGFTSKATGETNGLGLHWCANAVASMGGRIFAESAGAGQGAEFHVLLPAAQGG